MGDPRSWGDDPDAFHRALARARCRGTPGSRDRTARMARGPAVALGGRRRGAEMPDTCLPTADARPAQVTHGAPRSGRGRRRWRTPTAGAELAAGLGDLGASVAPLDLGCFGGRDGSSAALDATARRLGPLDGVVVASVGAGPTRRGRRRRARRARHGLPGRAPVAADPGVLPGRVRLPARRRRDRGAGGPDAVAGRRGRLRAWAAVTEGQRALAKAAARAWGQRGSHGELRGRARPPCSRTAPDGVRRRDASRPARTAGPGPRAAHHACRRRRVWCTHFSPPPGGR